MRVDRLLLPEAPAPADGLIERLVAVGQANKGDVVAALEVEAKPEDARLADQHADLAILKVDRSLLLVII